MDSFYGNSYQSNGGEKDFQKLAQLIGTNIQKISQNGKNIFNVFKLFQPRNVFLNLILIIFYSFMKYFYYQFLYCDC